MNKTKSRVLMPRLGFSVLIDIFSHVIDSVIYFFWSCSTSLVKFFLRKCTGLCELQRICYKTEKGAQRSLAVEKCINSSRREVVTRIREKLDELAQNVRFNSTNTSEVIQSVEHAVAAICIEKAIKPSIHLDFMIAMRICFLQIYGYKNLVHEIESLRSIVYDSSDPEHEKKLKSLWESLSPDNPLKERKSRQWTEIGFQGDDPMTDFRGMGLLGLENLLFLSRNHNKTAKLILLHSSHPSYGFPFAITGINITHIAYNLLKSGELKTHFFNSIFGTTCLDDFHKVYCYLFYMFDQLWMSEKPKDVMEFSHIREKFLVSVREKLAKFDTILVFNPPVEDV